jgi:hypothetical protein
METSDSIQSGFVLAAIIAAVLFASRLGGGEEVARRIYQVALGVLLAFAVIGATTAFIRAPEVPEALREDNFDSSEEQEEAEYEFFEDVANRNSAATTTHAGAGAVALMAGLFAMRRFRTLSLGIGLGGLLLIIFGGVTTSGTNTDPSTFFLAAYSSLLSSTIGSASRGLDIAHFAVVAGSFVALLMFGYTRWDETAPAAVASTPET